MSEISIRNITNYPLNVNGSLFFGSSIGHSTPARTNGEFHYRSNSNGVYVCWVGANGVRYCAKGIDAGSTSEAARSVWVPSGASSSLRFSNGSRQFRIDQVQIRNSISNTTLFVYSNSSRTNLLGSINANSTISFSYLQTYYLTSSGLGPRSVNSNYVINNSAAGHLYNITGTYNSGQNDVYSCTCSNLFSQTLVASCSSSSSTIFCETVTDFGECIFTLATCRVECFLTFESQTLPWQRDEYRCRTNLISSGNDGFFSTGPTINLTP
jgi:hypothetical protein